MKLLLVEDEAEIARFIVRGFKTEGFRVTHVETAEDALNFLQSQKFDAIILDLLLPSMSGEELLRKMREEKDNTPVIVLSAMGASGIKTRLLNQGADDYLVKPFSFVELVARVQSILRRFRNQVGRSGELAVGDLKLIPSMRMVTRGEKSIKLRLREYVLLEYLMRHSGEVVNRNTLIENVWDYNLQLLSNTVDSHVSLLRKKINTGFEEKLIDTVHGVGYILSSKPRS